MLHSWVNRIHGSNTVICNIAAIDAHRELDPDADAMDIDLSKFNGSLSEGKDDTDSSCWTSPCGTEFMIRGKNYLKDNSKVSFFLPGSKMILMK